MNSKWLVVLPLLTLLIAGCLEEKQSYDDDSFLEWLNDKISENADLDDSIANALDENDYDKVEVLADISYNKNLENYHTAQSFDVSNKFKELQKHAILYFNYHYQADFYLKLYAEYVKAGDYGLALYYIDQALYYTNKTINELDIMNNVLGVMD